MKTLLIKPPTGSIYKSLRSITPEYPPLGLAYIAAFLESAGHEAKILDMSVEPQTKQSLYSLVRKYNPEIIGMTANTATVETAYEILTDLRQEFPENLYVMGGPHPTAIPEESLAYSDIVVRAEAEETFLEITNAYSKRSWQKSDLKEIKGISAKIDGTILHTENRPINNDIDGYPLPARHLLKMGAYHYFGARRSLITNMITSRGCPFNCNYCNKNIFGHKFRARGAESVLQEIDCLVTDFGIKEIHISDDTFNMDKKRALDICRMIKHRGYDLAFYPHNGIRVDSVDAEQLSGMKSAGFYAMVYGVESGNQQILNNIGKGTTLEQARTAFKLSKRMGFETWGFFILGLKGETRQTALDTIRFAKELDPDFAKFHILVPYPGTCEYERLKNRMLIKKWSDFSIFNSPTFEPDNMASHELNNLFQYAVRSFYLRPMPIMRTMLRTIRSPNTAKENIRAGLSVLGIPG